MPMKRTREAVLLLGMAVGLAASTGYAWAETTVSAERPFAVAQVARGGGGGRHVETEEEKKKKQEELRKRRQQRRKGAGAQPEPQKPHRARPAKRAEDSKKLEMRRRHQERMRRKAGDEARPRREQDARKREMDERRHRADDRRRKKAEAEARRREQDARSHRVEDRRRKKEEAEARRRERDARRHRAEDNRRKKEEAEARRERAKEKRRKAGDARRHKRENDGIGRRTGGGTPHLILPRPTAKERETRRSRRREFARERLKDVAKKRRRERDASGRTVIVEPGNRRIVKGRRGRAIIQHDETERFRGYGRNFRTEKGRGGRHRTVVTRPDGIVIITITDKDGRLLRRIKRHRDGREVVLIDNRRDRRHRRRHRRGRGRDGGFGFFVELPAPVISIPRERYSVDADEASDDDVYEALNAPPVDDIEPDYTLDEIRHSPSIRNRLRRVMSSVNFEFGSWELRDEQIARLETVGRAMRAILRRKPDEMFLVGGHTDAVGSDEDNLSLSDRRAGAVARVLTDEFGVPAENLVTQGYGEQYLVIDTQSPEVRNRRVEFQRITPALARGGGSASADGGGQGDNARDDGDGDAQGRDGGYDDRAQDGGAGDDGYRP